MECLKHLLENARTHNQETYKTMEEVVKDLMYAASIKVRCPDFNEKFAVDKNVWNLHVIDLFTRFSAGAIMRTKVSLSLWKIFLNAG